MKQTLTSQGIANYTEIPSDYYTTENSVDAWSTSAFIAGYIARVHGNALHTLSFALFTHLNI